jgi:hypothetical protein
MAATAGPAPLLPLPPTLDVVATLVAERLPASLAARDAAPHVSALLHLASLAAATRAILPMAALGPLLAALVQRGAWRDGVAIVSDLMRAHGAAAVRPALEVLGGELCGAVDAARQSGRGVQAQQMAIALELVRYASALLFVFAQFAVAERALLRSCGVRTSAIGYMR